MPTTTFTVTKDATAVYTGGGGQFNGGDNHHPVGKWDPGTGLSWNTRALVYAPVSFSGMTAINEARLYFYAHIPGSGWHANGSGTNSFGTRRKTVDWSETSCGTSGGGENNWGGNGTGDTLVNSGFADDLTPNASLNSDAADETLMFFDITEIVEKWFTGSPNYGILVFAVGTNSSDAIEFYSRETTGLKPYIWIDYSTNTAPNAPTNLSPTGSEVVHTGTTFTATGTRSDPDSGDYITAYQIVTYKNDGTTLVNNTGTVTVSGTPTTFSRTINVGSNGANKYYKWKARTRDKSNVWGPYSSLQRVKLNTVPNTPTLNTPDDDTLTPSLSGSYSDPDSNDGMTAVQIQVVRTSDGTTMWSSGDLADSGSSWSKTYAGTALAWDTTYKYRARVKDENGAYSSWSSYKTWTTEQPSGPTISPRSSGVKTDDTTPDLTISYSENFTDHELFVYSNKAGTTQVFSSTPTAYTATTSKVVTCTTVLTNGGTYYWKARVFIQSSGTWSEWAGFVSGQSGNLSAQIYVNALPTAPTGLSARQNPESAPVLRPSDSVPIVTITIPLLEAQYSDPDLGSFGDTPTARSIEIYNNSTGALVHSNEDLSPVFSDPMVYFPGTISNTTTLAAAALAEATNIKVTSVTGFAVNDYVRIGTGGTQEVRRILTVGTAGSGGTGLTLTEPLAYDKSNGAALSEITAVLSTEVTYKMRWRFKDSSGVYGSWSSYKAFKMTQPSSVSTLTPSGTISSPAFTATWSHTSPGSKAQGVYRLTVTRDSDSEIVYDTGEISSSTESHDVPGGYLVNSENYTLGVEVVDTDGV